MKQPYRHLYPFQSHFMPINGHRYHYVDEGRGPAVLMLHGNPTWSFYYRHLIAALAPGHRVIAPDHIGCGLSDKPGAQAYGYRLEDRVADLETFIHRLVPDTPLTLVVHDWGGMIGMAFALRHLSQIQRLVITNTSGFLAAGRQTHPASAAPAAEHTAFRRTGRPGAEYLRPGRPGHGRPPSPAPRCPPRSHRALRPPQKPHRHPSIRAGHPALRRRSKLCPGQIGG